MNPERGAKRPRSIRLYAMQAGRKGPNSTSIRSANLPRPSMAEAFSVHGSDEQIFGRIQQVRETGQCETQPDGPRTTCGAQTKHERIPMFRTLMIGAVSALALSTAAFAQQGSSPQEARAMLDKAVAAVKADQAVALAMFLKGEGGFLDRDLYPFCFRIA